MRTPVIDTCSGSIEPRAPLRISIRSRNIIVDHPMMNVATVDA